MYINYHYFKILGTKKTLKIESINPISEVFLSDLKDNLGLDSELQEISKIEYYKLTINFYNLRKKFIKNTKNMRLIKINSITLLCNACSNPTLYSTELKSVSNDDVLEIIENKKHTFLYVARPTCDKCIAFTPLVTSIASEFSIEIPYFNTDVARIEDEEKLNEIIKELNLVAVPTLLEIKNGLVINSITGIASEDEIIDFLNIYN